MLKINEKLWFELIMQSVSFMFLTSIKCNSGEKRDDNNENFLFRSAYLLPLR